MNPARLSVCGHEQLTLGVSRFRWVALQLNELENCANARAVNRQLAALPKGLEGTYEQILCKIPLNCHGDVKRFLQWLAFSTRSMTVEEIADVVVVDFSSEDGPCYAPDLRYMDPKDVLSACSSLVTQFQGTT